MTRFIAMGVLIFIGVMGWRIGERLSPDALGMALGVLFGVMAGIPAALMVLAAHRREGGSPYEAENKRLRAQLEDKPQPPPIIILNNGQALPYAPSQTQADAARQIEVQGSWDESETLLLPDTAYREWA